MSVITLWGTTPAPQGSKNPWGGEANKNLAPWREALAAAGVEQMAQDEAELIPSGPVGMEVAFFFPRPAAHYGTGKNAGVLKDTAPNHKASKPDLDKLMRAIGDALTGVAFRDDSQIAKVEMVKLYGEKPGVSVLVYALAS